MAGSNIWYQEKECLSSPFALRAEDDLQRIVDFYDNINPKLSDLFLEDLQRSLKSIEDYPQGYQIRFEQVRAKFLKKFSFGVYYKTYPVRISVIAILHSSQDPEIWKGRS